MSAMKLTATMADGTVHDLEVRNPERVRWDITRAKHNWPTAQDAPFLMTTFMAWAAMKRLGLYSSPFEQFRDADLIDLEAHDTDGADSAPTP